VLLPRRLTVVARQDGDLLAQGPSTGSDPRQLLRAWEDSTCPEHVVVAAPDSTGLAALESGRFPETLRERGFVLGATLRTGAGVRGAVLLGRRVTGRHYVRRELGFLRDVVERASAHLDRIELSRQVREEQALHRAKNEFLSRVSHDLRTPLTSISWSVQNLLDGVVGDLPERQREYLRDIGHSCGYLNRLVQNLLRLSRLERGALEAHCRPLDVADVVRASLTTVGPVARARDVTVRPTLPAGASSAWGDPELLEEALVNLLENAVEFSPPGGTVDVSVERDENGPRVLVRDRGPGLPPGGAAALFERFSRGPESPFASHQGMGLGLHIANVHLGLMEGSLHAADHPDGGAVFTCALRSDPPAAEGSA
jgi:signal transduction histidine kinase